MKSNIKLIFKEEITMKKFSILFFNYLSQHKYWLKNCNFHSIKNNLYIHTHNYCSIDNFKKFIRTALKTNPIVVEYKLANIKYKPVLLDEYCIAQYYPETNIETSDGTIAFCFYKALDYDANNNETNKVILQFNL